MRIAFVGNSHIASLRLGLGILGGSFEHDVEMWAMNGRAFPKRVQIEGTRLLGLPRVFPQISKPVKQEAPVFDGIEYDLVIIYGESLSLEEDARAFASLDETASYSSQLRTALYDEFGQDLFAFQYAAKLSEQGVHTLLHSVPLIGETKAASPVTKADISRVIEFRQGLAKKIGVDFLVQPLGTLAEDGVRTSRRYLDGNPHLDNKVRSNDIKHMNGDFGAAVLLNIVKHLGKKCQG